MLHSGFRRPFASAAIIVFLLSGAASAQDADAVADLLVSLTERGGGKETKYASATTDGGNVVITDFYSRMKNDDADVTLATIRIVDPVIDADGGLQASAITADGIAIASRDANITIATLETKNVHYPSPTLPEKEFIAKTKSAYESVEAREILIVSEQKSEVPIARFALSNSEVVDGLAHKVSFVAEGIVVDPGLATDPEARERAKALGYDKITLGAAIDAHWDEAANTVNLNRFEFGGKDVGYLKLTAAIGGITRELALSTSQEDASKYWQNVTLNAMAVSFDNDSIVERVVAQQAVENGTTPDELINETVTQLPDMMAVLGNPDLAAQATEALSAFLKAPKNLTLQAKPEAGVPIVQVAGMAMFAPAAALDMLKVEITANK